jgi:TonB-dependent starch-binding outer membrane protein SusC
MKKTQSNYFFVSNNRIKKIILTMKITSLLLLVNLLQISAIVSSQTTRISLKAENATIKQVFTEIEKVSEFRFLYHDGITDLNKLVSLNVNQENVMDVLNEVFRETSSSYKVLDNNLIVVVPVANGIQKVKVTGKVTDGTTGEPLIGVNVIVKGTTLGVVTDIDGKFSLEIPDGNSTLVVSSIGYTAQEVVVGNQQVLTIVLQAETKQLEEIVVVGYGTTKKVTATGSVVSAKGDDLKQSPGTNLTNNLVGRLPGLVATSSSGEPGSDDATLRIRGVGTLGDASPLVVVDGIANRSMARLDPSDIESVNVLKDASAAIYGAQAANGVILVTTKRGKLGKPKISISMNAGVNQPTVIPKMANAEQYATMLNEIGYYKNPSGGRFQAYTQDDLTKYADGSDPWGHPNTDWFKEVFKTWSNQNYENVSISGGTENMKYFLSLGARYEDAYYKKSATFYKQYDFRSNIDGKVNKYIDIAFDVAGREEYRNYPTRSAGSIFRMLMRGKPNMPAYWPDGTPGPDIEYGDNPAVTSTSATGYDRDKWYVLESNLRTNVKIPWVNGLTVTANASFDKAFQFHKKFETPWYLYSWDGNANHILTKGLRGLAAPQLSENMEDKQKITLNAYATYEKTLFEKHNIKVMVGTERQSGTRDLFSAFRKDYISSAVDQLFAGAPNQYMVNDGSASQDARMNYFGRVNYDFGQKYMVEFLWRYDGSYMFTKGKQFGFFPGISAGWRISEENFFKNNVTFVDNLKLRASWGQLGNDRIKEYQYLASYSYDVNHDGKIDGSDNRSYVFGTQDGKLLGESKVPNPNVTWEVANTANIGLDAFFLGNKLSVSGDYFYNRRSQILIQRNASVPTSSGITLPPENIGKVDNRGFEAIIGYHNQVGGLKYDVSVNGSYSKNKVVFWDETPGRPEWQKATGKTIPDDVNNPDGMLRYQAIGIFVDQAQVDATTAKWAGARPGDVIFKDVNNDGKIDGLDRVRADKTGMPRFIGGFTVNLNFMNFDFAVLFQGAMGAEKYISPESGDIGNYYKIYADNRWTPENPSSTYPRAWNRDEEYWRSQGNTFWVHNMNYLRIKNIELGYNLPTNLNKVIGVEGLRVYVNALNLLTFSKEKLIDPELGAGTDYPLQRIINAGFSITF